MFTSYSADMVSLTHNLIKWVIDDPNPGSLHIDLAVGETPDSTEPIATVVASDGSYNHYHQKAFHRLRSLYYRLTLRDGATILDVSPSFTVTCPDIDENTWLWVERIRDYWTTLTQPLTTIYVFNKRTWGPACQRCYDEVYDKSADANCTICYGTGIAGGYFSPIKTRAAISPQIDTIGTKHELTDETFAVKLGHYPLLRVDDVIVTYLEGRKEIGVVGQVSSTMFAGLITSQTANVSRLTMNDVRRHLLEQCK